MYHRREWVRKKVLVTGARGFKGTWLTALLVRLGAAVYALVSNRSNPESAYDLLGLKGQVTEVHADVTNKQRMRDLISAIRPAGIFHLAAKSLVPVALCDPVRAFEVNVLGTLGPGDVCARRVVPVFLQKALHDKVVPLTTRLNGRQFIPVTDCVAGYIMAMSKLGELPQTNADGRGVVPTLHFALETYAGTPEPFLRIEDLAKIVAGLTGARVEEQPGCVDFMPNENPVQGLECRRTRELLGWAPRQDFEMALTELVEFYRANGRRERVRIIRRTLDAAAEHLDRMLAGVEHTTPVK